MRQTHLDRMFRVEAEIEFEGRRVQRGVRREPLGLGVQEDARRPIDAAAVVAIAGFQFYRHALSLGADGDSNQLLQSNLVTLAGTLTFLLQLLHEVEEEPVEQIAHLQWMQPAARVRLGLHRRHQAKAVTHQVAARTFRQRLQHAARQRARPLQIQGFHIPPRDPAGKTRWCCRGAGMHGPQAARGIRISLHQAGRHTRVPTVGQGCLHLVGCGDFGLRRRWAPRWLLLQLVAGLLEQRRGVRFPPVSQVQAAGQQRRRAGGAAEKADQVEDTVTRACRLLPQSRRQRTALFVEQDRVLHSCAGKAGFVEAEDVEMPTAAIAGLVQGRHPQTSGTGATCLAGMAPQGFEQPLRLCRAGHKHVWQATQVLQMGHEVITDAPVALGALGVAGHPLPP